MIIFPRSIPAIFFHFATVRMSLKKYVVVNQLLENETITTLRLWGRIP
jgi:hypothetical protein